MANRSKNNRRIALLGLGLVTASQATSLWQFQLFFGVLIGVAAGRL